MQRLGQEAVDLFDHKVWKSAPDSNLAGVVLGLSRLWMIGKQIHVSEVQKGNMRRLLDAFSLLLPGANHVLGLCLLLRKIHSGSLAAAAICARPLYKPVADVHNFVGHLG